MTLNFPAPEEARTFKDYVSLFKQRNPGVDFKDACQARAQVIPGDLKAHFDWCWQQPEAEAIHQAFKQ